MTKEEFIDNYLAELKRKYKVYDNPDSILIVGTNFGSIRLNYIKNVAIIISTGKEIKSAFTWLYKNDIISKIKTKKELEYNKLFNTKLFNKRQRIDNFINIFYPMICSKYQASLRADNKECIIIHNNGLGTIYYYPTSDDINIRRKKRSKWYKNGLLFLRDKKVL